MKIGGSYVRNYLKLGDYLLIKFKKLWVTYWSNSKSYEL